MSTHKGGKPVDTPLLHELKQFYTLYKPQIWVSILFIIGFGLFYSHYSQADVKEYVPTVIKLESIDVCEGFDTSSYQTVGCNHRFYEGIQGLSVFYYVSFNVTPNYNLTIKWFHNDELVTTGQNDFTFEGKPVDPGEYLLAMPSQFEQELGNYTIELYEGPYFLGQVYYAILPQESE